MVRSASPLSALPSSPLSTLSSPPNSPPRPPGGDNNNETTHHQQQQERDHQDYSYDVTPKIGSRTPKARKELPMIPSLGRTSAAAVSAYNDVSNSRKVEEEEAAPPTPSWDMDANNFFHSCVHHQPLEDEPFSRTQRSFTSFSGLWERFGGGGSRSGKSEHELKEKGAGGSDDKTVQGASSSDEEESLKEAGENDLFAQEVGLMFSTDDGDTIRDEQLFSQTLSQSMSRGLSASFTNDSGSQRTSNKLLALAGLGGLRRNRSRLSDKCDDDSEGESNNYMQNTKYAVPQTQPSHNDLVDESIHGPQSIQTSGQSTTLSNKIPSNAKMILGYKNAKRHKDEATAKAGRNQAFPIGTTGDNPISAEEMEKRLREIAGRLNADWREPSFMPPALARRLRDFQFARAKRTKRYGVSRPWGILGLYDHLSGVKVDVEWAEDAAWRRQNHQPYLTWGDFEKAKNKGLNSPFFTHFTVSVCTAMMIASLQVNGWRFEPLAVNPMIGPSAETLLKLGAKDSYLIVDELEVWRVASPMVLHAGLIHFFLNMFALWFVGRAIEQIHGFFPAVVQFVVPAIGGTILSAIFLPEYITVGASGGIFGLIGACISDIFMNWALLFNQFVNEKGTRLSHARVLLVLAIDIVVNCLIGLTPFVDNFTHLGGMVYGFLCGLGTIQLVSPKFFQKDNLKSPSCFARSKRIFFRFFGLLVSLAGIAVSSYFLMSGDGETNPCTSCTYMSCIAFPPWTSPNNKWWYCDDCARATATGTLENGIFASLNVTCPNGKHEVLQVDESWPQDELGLEGMLPMLCREHCLW